MKYISTRSGEKVTLSQALLRGLASDGGLYVPEELPTPFVNFDEMKQMEYSELAAFVLHRFLIDIPEEELSNMTRKAYEGTFRRDDVVPVIPLGDGVSVAEMFHGRTCAFKDLALSLFPYLLTWAKKHEGERDILILTATSGDTGKAALEGFRDVEGVHIMVFYPSKGVSALQMDQMQKQEGHNVRVVGIVGNFDQAQGALKEVFQSNLRRECEEKGLILSSANSINIGRLLPQVVYYVWIWLELLRKGCIEDGESFRIVVPTGNFGNILAAWMAKQIGVPIERFLCASNENHILSDVLATGEYNVHRGFYLTESPSMDILVSSNFERFLYYMGASKELVTSSMKGLRENGIYHVPQAVLRKMQSIMDGGWVTTEEMEETVRCVYEANHYLLDPHTAVAYAVYMKHFLKKGKSAHTVIASTAHPYKFPDALAHIFNLENDGTPYDVLRKGEDMTGVPIPDVLGALEHKEKRFVDVIPANGIEEAVRLYGEYIRKEKKNC